MKKTLFIFICILGLNTAVGQKKSQTADPRQLIWTNFLQPLIDNKLDSLINYVTFPLQGDWGAMMGHKEPPEKLNKNHFIKGFDKVFTKDFIEKTKKQSYKDISSNKSKDGSTEYLFSVGFVTMVDGFKDESGIILRFKKIKGTYKLYVIQGVG